MIRFTKIHKKDINYNSQLELLLTCTKYLKKLYYTCPAHYLNTLICPVSTGNM